MEDTPLERLRAALHRCWTKLSGDPEWAQVALLILQTLLIPGTILVAVYQIGESSQLAWRTFLDERTADLDDRLIDNPVLGCLFDYKLDVVTRFCNDLQWNSGKAISLLTYAEEILTNLLEIREYADDDEEYYDWYRGLLDNLREDQLGAFSFVLLNYLCADEENPCYSEALRTVLRLQICPPGDREECDERLRERADRFRRRMGDASPPSEAST